MRLDHERLLPAIYPLFAVSGFCGLVYESIWSHYLKLFLGHAAYAQSLVLIVFIGGMAIGAWLAGRYSDRIANPLVAYALAELLVGVGGIAFHTVFVAATDWAYDTLLPGTCSEEGLCFSSWLLAALLILPQSILLGTTFPLMATGAIRAYPRAPGKSIAALYFLNSLGAVFGVLISTFVLIPRSGLPGTTITAGVVNVLLAVTTYLIARVDSIHERLRFISPAGSNATAPLPPRWLLWVALLTGLSSFIYEVVWIRMLSLVLGSSTHAFELMLASFILGLAIGGAWIRKRIDRLSDPKRFLAGVQIAMGVLALLSLVLYDASFDVTAWMIGALAKSDTGYALYNAGSAGIAMAIMLPPTVMAGMTLPLITFLLLRGGYGERSVGYVYAWNTFGSIVGVLLVVHVGLPWLGMKGSLITGAAIDVGLGLLLLRPDRAGERRQPGFAVVAVLAATLLLAAPWWFEIDVRKTAAGVFRTGAVALDDDQRVLFNEDGKTATISVVENDELVSIRTNGKPDAAIRVGGPAGEVAYDEPTMALIPALVLAQSPGAKTAAVIGFGSGMSTSTLLMDPRLERVDTIEIEPMMVRGAQHFRPVTSRAYDDPRSNIVIDDARSYFARSKRRYDLIVSEPSNPWVSGVSSLFTEEFYRRVIRYLSDDGVFGQWIQLYEFDDDLLATITTALDAVFGDYAIYASVDGDVVIVARKTGTLGRASDDVFGHPDLAKELSRLGFRNADDLERRRLAGRATIRTLFSPHSTPANSDYFPVVDNLAARARFKATYADHLPRLQLAPVPIVEILERRAPLLSPPSPELQPVSTEASARETDAQQIYTFVMAYDGATSQAALRSLPMAPQVGVLTLIMQDCADAKGVEANWDSVIAVAAAVNPSLLSRQTDALWRRIAGSKRIARMSPERMDWVELFAAVGRRDAQRMASLSDRLLPGAATAAETEYLVAAGATGFLGMHDIDRARQILARDTDRAGSKHRNLGWYRLLTQAAGL